MERFWSKVSKTSECWEWTAQIMSNGYGRFYYQGRQQAAHRVSYLLATGTYPGEFQVCHTCDNRKCVRPEHLWLGTRSDNMKDCFNKGRAVIPRPTGADHHNIKKSHCPRGHEYSEMNTYLNSKGSRVCRTCKTIQYQKYKKDVK